MASIYDKSSLVLIPSGTKTGKVYSQKPTNGDGDFTFTRSSAATRVNADGNIEKETMNLMPYSNDFSQWLPKNGTFTQGVADPFGGNNAWSLTATNTDPYLYRNPSVTGVITLSIWAKGVGSSIGKNFLIVSGGSSPNTSSHTLTSEWVRYEGYFNATSTNVIGFEIPNPGVVGDVVHIYGAQLEYGLVARDYIETTTSAVYGGITDNVPRLDYTDSSCPALLLEPLRTNLIPNSEYFNAWTKVDVTPTNNYGISPEGVQNSTRVVFADASAYMYIAPTGTNSGTYSTAIYIKGTDGETIKFGKGGNVASGAIHTLNGDWQRIEHITTDVGLSVHLSTFGGSTARDMEIWGCQLEAGSYPTSYIPTYGSSVSRVGEGCSTSNVEELIGQTEGTIFYQGLVEETTGNDGHAIAFTQDANGNGSSRFLLYRSNSTGNMKVYFQNASGVAFGQATLPIPTSSNDKYAIAYSTNDLAIYVNGVLEHTQSVGVIPTTNFVNINKWSGNMKHKNECRNVLLFKTRLSNEELADLTTL